MTSMVVNATRLFTVDEANSLLELINPIIIELSDYSVKQEMLEEQLEEIMEEVKAVSYTHLTLPTILLV